MIAEFFANSALYSSAEIRGIKAASADRGTYGDAAIGYVQLKRDGSMCVVKAKICPEHKVRNANYNVTLCIDEAEDRVEALTCHDCAASLGGCKHAIAFIMWVHRRSEEPAPTETFSYWRKSKLAGVGTANKFIKVEDFKKIATATLPLPSNGNFLQRFIEIGKEKGISSQILKYYTDEEDSLKKLSIHNLLLKFLSGGGVTAEDFFEYAKEVMTAEDCEEACETTVDQSNNKLWHELHCGRITASRLYEASRCKKSTGTLVESIIGSLKIPETEAMKRGKILEAEVLKVLEKELKTNLNPVGLKLSPDHPYLGATPDALGDDFVVEVKCPTSMKTFESYIHNCEITNKFKAQITLQMYLFDKQYGIFCVADPLFESNSKITILRVSLDDEFLETLMDSAKTFWVNSIYPVLVKSLQN